MFASVEYDVVYRMWNSERLLYCHEKMPNKWNEDDTCVFSILKDICCVDVEGRYEYLW